MSKPITIERNPGKPKGRWFVVNGKPQTLKGVYTLTSESEAYNAGFMMAESIFRIHKAKEVRLYPYEGHDRIAVFLKSAADWDKPVSTSSTQTVEAAMHGYIHSRLIQQGNQLLRNMDSNDSTKMIRNGNHIADQMEIHLQKIKPETVDEHGGKVRVIEFKADKGLLKIGFGQACSSACPASSLGTKLAIEPRMRSRFPEIAKVEFIME